MKPLTEVMQWIKQIDNVATDNALVLYTKTRLNGTELDRVVQAVKQIRDDQDLPVMMIIPYEELELRVLNDSEKARIIHALGGKTAAEVAELHGEG